jgi:hypothetical protein
MSERDETVAKLLEAAAKKRRVTSSTAKAKKPKRGKKPKLIKQRNTKEDRLDADARLTAFICGEIPLVKEDGSEHWHDPEDIRRYTLQDIASLMGVTRERVRQIEQKALKKAFAMFSTMAHKEGENAIMWFRQLFAEMDNISERASEYDMPRWH